MKNLIKVATILTMSLMVMTSCKKDDVNNVTVTLTMDDFVEVNDGETITQVNYTSTQGVKVIKNIDGYVDNVNWNEDFSIIVTRTDSVLIFGQMVYDAVGAPMNAKFTLYLDGKQIDYSDGPNDTSPGVYDSYTYKNF